MVYTGVELCRKMVSKYLVERCNPGVFGEICQMLSNGVELCMSNDVCRMMSKYMYIPGGANFVELCRIVSKNLGVSCRIVSNKYI